MEEKENQNNKSKGGGLAKLLLENIFVVVRSFVEKVFDNAQETAAVFTRNLIVRIFLVVFIVVGIVFLLIGMARLISAQYQIPGGGEALVGLAVLFVSFVLYALIIKK